MRISRHTMYMRMAEAASCRSTCSRASVGAILINASKNFIVSMGYNGPSKEEPHCTGISCISDTSKGCHRSIHAEDNAVRNAKRAGIDIEDSRDMLTIYCTHQPCLNCAKIITKSGIDTVFYMHPYRCSEGLLHLVSSGVYVYQLLPSGLIINKSTGEMIEELPK